ncbi:uncharacterized protein LOC133191229 [Saccostrea echinata]|uniref:uncharacterized protein LOC133191229 n=1 Tax=Saccostrea echinata TaxID=191078 RepID=UPI002A81703F|nr:uncharacterized protein LOC133191229 [Saccostrea echinata]
MDAKEPDKDAPPPPPPYEEVCTMPGHQSLSPTQPYDMNSFASPSDVIISPHCYAPPSSLMHGAYQHPQPFIHDYNFRDQRSQNLGITPHDVTVLARMRNRPVALFAARVPMDDQRRRIYIKIFTLVILVIVIIIVVGITQWFR